MDLLRAATDACKLVDLRFKGFKFTWRKARNDPNSIRERIDRLFATHEFIDMFGYIEVEHRNWHRSDHVPIVVSSIMEDKDHAAERKKRPIRFEERWTG